MTDEITRGDYFAPVRSDVSMKVGVPGIGTRSIIAAILGTFVQAAAMHRSIGMETERLTCGWSCSYAYCLCRASQCVCVCVCGRH